MREVAAPAARTTHRKIVHQIHVGRLVADEADFAFGNREQFFLSRRVRLVTAEARVCHRGVGSGEIAFRSGGVIIVAHQTKLGLRRYELDDCTGFENSDAVARRAIILDRGVNMRRCTQKIIVARNTVGGLHAHQARVLRGPPFDTCQ